MVYSRGMEDSYPIASSLRRKPDRDDAGSVRVSLRERVAVAWAEGSLWKWPAVIVGGAAVLAALGFGAFYAKLELFDRNPRFELKTVNVVTTGTALSEVEVERLTGIRKGKNMFALDVPKIRRDFLRALPNIRDIRIERVPPDTMNVQVMERVAVVRSPSNRRMVLDVDGFCFALQPWQDAKADTLPRIRSEEWDVLLPGQRASERIRIALNTLDVADYMGISLRIVEVDTTSPHFLTVLFADRREVALPWKALRQRKAQEMLVRVVATMNSANAVGYGRFEVEERRDSWHVYGRAQ